MLEIETILKSRLKTLVVKKELERFASRLYDTLDALVKRVDLETYGTFNALALDEGSELEDSFSDVSPEDKASLRELAVEFFNVRCFTIWLTVDFQRLRNVE